MQCRCLICGVTVCWILACSPKSPYADLGADRDHYAILKGINEIHCYFLWGHGETRGSFSMDERMIGDAATRCRDLAAVERAGCTGGDCAAHIACAENNAAALQAVMSSGDCHYPIDASPRDQALDDTRCEAAWVKLSSARTPCRPKEIPWPMSANGPGKPESLPR